MPRQFSLKTLLWLMVVVSAFFGGFELARLRGEVAAGVVGGLPGVEKVNVGALGNVVRQLHAHVVGRRVGDAAWPGPVWGHGRAEAFGAQAREALLKTLRDGLRTAPV